MDLTAPSTLRQPRGKMGCSRAPSTPSSEIPPALPDAACTPRGACGGSAACPCPLRSPDAVLCVLWGVPASDWSTAASSAPPPSPGPMASRSPSTVPPFLARISHLATSSLRASPPAEAERAVRPTSHVAACHNPAYNHLLSIRDLGSHEPTNVSNRGPHHWQGRPARALPLSLRRSRLAHPKGRNHVRR